MDISIRKSVNIVPHVSAQGNLRRYLLVRFEICVGFYLWMNQAICKFCKLIYVAVIERIVQRMFSSNTCTTDRLYLCSYVDLSITSCHFVDTTHNPEHCHHCHCCIIIVIIIIILLITTFLSPFFRAPVKKVKGRGLDFYASSRFRTVMK